MQPETEILSLKHPHSMHGNGNLLILSPEFSKKCNLQAWFGDVLKRASLRRRGTTAVF
jgi:hypothetical protein